MKNKFKFTMLLGFILVIVLSSFSSAWIVPSSHGWINSESLKESNTEVSRVIKENYEDFWMCQSLTDYSVFFYLEDGFSTISKKYLASHNQNIAVRSVELADKSDEAQLSCAYGIASMSLQDSPSHNFFIPKMVERVGVPQALIHALSEQCVDNEIATPQLNAEGRSALVNKYEEHREFLIKVFQSDSRTGTIDVDNMMSSFVSEVAQSDKYSVGFRGFTAVPTSIHVILLLWFAFGMVALAYLIRLKNKGIILSKINKISIVLLLLLFILPVILIYILYFTGNIWRVFQSLSTPICWVMPISGYETYLNQAVANMVNFYNNGVSMIYQIPDPSGLEALRNADKGNLWKLWIIGLILAGLIALLVWLNLRKKK